MSKGKLTRRNVLGIASAAAAVSLTGLPSVVLAAGRQKGKKAKNIIFCVSDGMTFAVPTMLDHYLQKTTGKGSYWAWLQSQGFATNGLQDTRSLNSLVTDSSAASSSWGSGRYIWNGMVNAFPGVELTPIYTVFKDRAKMNTGLVTTATMTHATPAGFAVSHPSRDEERKIAEKYLVSGVDVLFGGGDRFFAAGKDKDGAALPDLYPEFAKRGYAVAKSRDEMLAAKGPKVLGIFSKSHVPYEIDRLNSAELQKSTPTLAEMSKKAIELLDGSSNGFILQIEGARIDHAAHSNDFGGILHDQHAFEQAVQVAVEFALKGGETLVIVTSDHGNSNPGLMGSGDEYGDSTAGLMSLSRMTSSYEAMRNEFSSEKLSSASSVQNLIESKLAIKLTKEESQFVLAALQGKSPLAFHDQFSSAGSALAMALSNHTHVSWSGDSHSSDYTLITAIGPGSEVFHGLTQNISVFDTLLSHRDIKFENPTMTFEEVKQKIAQADQVALAEAVSQHWL